MKKRKKGNLLKRTMTLLLSAVLIIDMAGTAPTQAYAAQSTAILKTVSGNVTEPVEEETVPGPVQGQETESGEEKEETGAEGAGEAVSEEQDGAQDATKEETQLLDEDAALMLTMQEDAARSAIVEFRFYGYDKEKSTQFLKDNTVP